MSFLGFVIGFTTALVGTMLIITLFKNSFIVSFIVALAIGIIAAKD